MHITNIIDRWQTEVAECDGREVSEWNALDTALDESQYSYIRLGLLIEKIRNKTYWKYCTEKYDSFKQWCERKLNLTVWQANAYMDAAKVAIYLAEAGYSKIPRNFSQAIALIPAYNAEVGYYQDRPTLERIWEIACKLPKITADAIKRLVNPDAIEASQKVSLPKHLRDRLASRAKARGVSVEELLDELLTEDEWQDEIAKEPEEIATEPDPELEKIIDRLERSWLEEKIIAPTVTAFDLMVENFVAKYRPKVQLK